MELLRNKYSPDIVDTLLNKTYLINKLGSVEINSIRCNDLLKNYNSDTVIQTKRSFDPYCKQNAGIYYISPFNEEFNARNQNELYDIFVFLYIKSIFTANFNFLYNFHITEFVNKPNSHLTKDIKFNEFNEDIGIYLELLEYYTTVLNKKVLVVSSMKDSIEKQLPQMKDIFPKYNINVKNIIVYKSFNTIKGNESHRNWYETYVIMKNDISKIEFDYCFLGCGAYGPPLGYFIYTSLNKSVFSIGASIQIMFGVIGNRWLSKIHIGHYFMRKYYNEHWIRPLKHEVPINADKVESSCYW